MPKQAKLNGIKSFRCYTVQEAADISGVSTHTIRIWGKNGLRIMDSTRPVLIRGDDLSTYIKAQRATRKVPTAPHQIYCVGCGGARHPAENMADCVITGKRAQLIALCEVCEAVLSKPVSQSQITELAKTLDLTIRQHATTL